MDNPERDAAFHKAPLIPVEWIVICPICEGAVPVEVIQDDHGAWGGQDADQFPECPECHAFRSRLCQLACRR